MVSAYQQVYSAIWFEYGLGADKHPGEISSRGQPQPYKFVPNRFARHDRFPNRVIVDAEQATILLKYLPIAPVLIVDILDIGHVPREAKHF